MEQLIRKYREKLEQQGLAIPGNAVFLGLDDEVVSTGPLDKEGRDLAGVFDIMQINTLLFAEPAEPYRSMMHEVLRYDESCRLRNKVFPLDCEMRTFFHDIPVIDDLTPAAVAGALSRRKSAIVRNRGIVTYGVVSPEQAFVSYSSTCFSLFVKYCYDSLMHAEGLRNHGAARGSRALKALTRIMDLTHSNAVSSVPVLRKGPPESEDGVIGMLAEAGSAVVDGGLVDSTFGNISYVFGSNIHISQTGSSLDELDRCIDAVPLDGSSSAGITASSELSTHRRIHERTGHRAILHGHPKFSVVLSMYCLKEGCDRSLCHSSCREARNIGGVPIVSGEIGTGPNSILNTVPEAMQAGRGAIVYGHGVFTSGPVDFRGPFQALVEIEEACRAGYLRLVQG